MSSIVSALVVVGFLATSLASPRIATVARIALIAAVFAQIALLDFGAALGPLRLRHVMVFVAAVDVGVALHVALFARTWLARVRDPLVLAPPFEGRWRVARGGPLRGLNHHVIARDQYFAYDFTAARGESIGRPILAPIAGIVVATENEMPDRAPSRNPDDPSIRGRESGNHVVIDSGAAYVFLCHLGQGSVRVAAGDRVEIGTPVGTCGNSGRTTTPHLHVHAQDAPAYAFGTARGLPVLFSTRRGPKLLWPFAVLASQ